MPITLGPGGKICIPGPTMPKGFPPSAPICWNIHAYRLEPSRHASAEPDLDPRLADVSILFSVYELAEQLSDHELRKVILSSVTDGIEAFAAQLPPGVELQFNGETFPRTRGARD